MISKDNYDLVKRAIKTHSRLKDRIYLILYKVNTKETAKAIEILVLAENFWHLVGCKIDDTIQLTPKDKDQLYADCLAGKDISNSLIYTRRPQDVSKKVDAFVDVFDFVTNAKSIRICRTDGSPEAAMFKIGAGNNNGVIGYIDKKTGLIPITVQQKSIYKIRSNANDKIVLIISKPYGYIKYNRVDYAVSKKIFPYIIDEIPPNILYERNLFMEYIESK